MLKRLFTVTCILPLTALCVSAAFGQSGEEGSPATGSKLTDYDRLMIGVQAICPVSGEKLGSMGEPIKVRIGQQTAYLCCQGCLGKQIKPNHWNSIQANFAKAQGTCPIMGNEVSTDKESIVVKGQRVFVCCPPCVEKIKSDPDAALQKVNANYTRYLNRQTSGDVEQLHIAAQGICPVSGQPLGSMGDPIKVQLGESQHGYLCCKACQSKSIKPEHWQTVQENLAEAQGTCPVMGKPVDASKRSTVVNHRRIFVCCPSCIEKIQAEPEKYLAKAEAALSESIKAKRNAEAKSNGGPGQVNRRRR